MPVTKRLDNGGATRRRMLAAAAVVFAPALRAQPRFPQRTITIVVPFGAGGIADLMARSVAEQMATRLGQPVVIENKPGAGSIVASRAVASAEPDGHTLLLMSNGHAVSVGLFRQLPVDPRRAFTPITTLGFFDLGLFVPAGSRFASLADLLAFAKANPGRLTVGSIAPGSTQHLAGRLFDTTAGVDSLAVPYNGSPAVLAALRGGQVDVAVEIVGPMLPQVQAGAVRALAVTGAQPNAALPGVPTVAQAGVAGYEVTSWSGLAAPAGTPAATLQTLHDAAQAALASPAVQQRLAALGVRLQGSTPGAMAALLAGEIERWGAVIRRAGLTPQ
ncbi:MAG: tripartite tricarboxylate transporter substrate binding protein [Burkholderiaceae bacterium]|nr:tripartite tricarboxylate transporter substrate binding protein [Burkholderiaceae bacterium]